MDSDTTTAHDFPADSDQEHDRLPKMSFLEHLEELRKRLLVSVIAVFAGFLLCWKFAENIFAKLQEPLTQYLPLGDKLAYTKLPDLFMLYMKVAFFTGLFVASPIVLIQLWLFIAPGLYPKERRYAIPFTVFATAFFILGGYFVYRVLLPGTCKFFVEQGRLFKQMIVANEFFSFASTIILASGLVFETPILIFFLARLGIVTPAFLVQKFRIAILLSFIISAVVTPTPDMVTCTALALPMIGLYALGIGIAFVFGKKPA